ncbi:hypothetical protein [Marinagarivorans algicola]|uniref:hypothetical protein n=1 Tax=Marinagarivorans algicola TaxID=1513270 RepID=UPI0006B4A03E|nr:hypothetical protein [Marinagarivorans algicola]
MSNLLLILGALFIGLIIMVKIAEWQSRHQTQENRQSINKLSRWILPLLALGFIIQIMTYFMNQ